MKVQTANVTRKSALLAAVGLFRHDIPTEITLTRKDGGQTLFASVVNSNEAVFNAAKKKVLAKIRKLPSSVFK